MWRYLELKSRKNESVRERKDPTLAQAAATKQRPLNAVLAGTGKEAPDRLASHSLRYGPTKQRNEPCGSKKMTWPTPRLNPAQTKSGHTREHPSEGTDQDDSPSGQFRHGQQHEAS